MQWWADLWNNWAKTWGYEEWVWGSAADWFGAVGTVGALALGLLLFAADRKEKKSKQAREFECIIATHLLADDEGDFVAWRADARNNSSGRIPYAGLRWQTKELVKKGWMVSPFYGEKGVMLGFDQNESGFAGFTLRVPYEETLVYVEILDANGKEWLRDHKGKWVSPRTVKKIMKQETKVYQVLPQHIFPRDIFAGGLATDSNSPEASDNPGTAGPVTPPRNE